MLERMRGAGRHQVEDVSFGFDFQVAEEEAPPEAEAPEPTIPSPPAPASAPRTANPNTSAKRRRINATEHEPAAPIPAQPLPPRSSGRRTSARQDAYDIPESTEDTRSVKTGTTTLAESAAVIRRSIAPAAQDDDADELESLPRPTPRTGSGTRGASRPSNVSLTHEVIDIVAESPAGAPGSGRRERVLAAASSSAALHRAVMQQQQSPDEADEISMNMSEFPTGLGVASSPLVRKAATRGEKRRSDISRASTAGSRSTRMSAASAGLGEVDELSPAGATRRSGRLSGGSVPDEINEVSPASARRSVRLSGASVPDEVDELSPERPSEIAAPASLKKKTPIKAPKGRKTVAKSPAKSSAKSPAKSPAKPPQKSSRKEKARPQPKPSPVPQPEEPDEVEEAQEIDETEAAQRLGRKRGRRSVAASASLEPEEVEPQEEEEPAAKRRRRKAPPQSPAAQQRPKTRKEKKQQEAEKPKKPTAKKKTKAATEDGDDELQGGTVPVTVQRFTKKVRLEHDADDEGADILALDSAIPFANRAGVNAVDVLSQMCDELVEGLLSNLLERGSAAEDAASRREFRTMMRALEAFREELRTRLLEHAIALDTLHALHKRVRTAQKNKLTLRQDILEIRAEREQVALKMDAVRIKHEEDSKEALVCFSDLVSSTGTTVAEVLTILYLAFYKSLLDNARYRLGRRKGTDCSSSYCSGKEQGGACELGVSD
jgi:hypothetical protein